jgi:hypothetical protein
MAHDVLIGFGIAGMAVGAGLIVLNFAVPPPVQQQYYPPQQQPPPSGGGAAGAEGLFQSIFSMFTGAGAGAGGGTGTGSSSQPSQQTMNEIGDAITFGA